MAGSPEVGPAAPKRRRVHRWGEPGVGLQDAMDRQVGRGSLPRTGPGAAVGGTSGSDDRARPPMVRRAVDLLELTNNRRWLNAPPEETRMPVLLAEVCPTAQPAARGADVRRSAAPVHRRGRRSGLRRALPRRKTRQAPRRCPAHAGPDPIGIRPRPDCRPQVSNSAAARHRPAAQAAPISPLLASTPLRARGERRSARSGAAHRSGVDRPNPSPNPSSDRSNRDRRLRVRRPAPPQQAAARLRRPAP